LLSHYMVRAIAARATVRRSKTEGFTPAALLRRSESFLVLQLAVLQHCSQF
jgi:hypothetical protein